MSISPLSAFSESHLTKCVRSRPDFRNLTFSFFSVVISPFLSLGRDLTLSLFGPHSKMYNCFFLFTTSRAGLSFMLLFPWIYDCTFALTREQNWGIHWWFCRVIFSPFAPSSTPLFSPLTSFPPHPFSSPLVLISNLGDFGIIGDPSSDLFSSLFLLFSIFLLSFLFFRQMCCPCFVKVLFFGHWLCKLVFMILFCSCFFHFLLVYRHRGLVLILLYWFVDSHLFNRSFYLLLFLLLFCLFFSDLNL